MILPKSTLFKRFEIIATDEKASVSTYVEAAAFGELVIIAILWNGIINIIGLTNSALLHKSLSYWYEFVDQLRFS